ncbi:ion transporter [Tropicibacter sp. R16_0]|uniref:ion transporter n=1 Tax=Tropicibacter sp. R16_0 TaxID=2821102 RepID=UPI001ADAF4ED|nr:ion transporter [Tropicibacter sp. R16_0]MBO9451674.1 ion transporter [Tropicibacter sp. R16_0]
MIEATHGNKSLRAKLYWWLERPDRSATGPWLLEIALIVLISLNVGAVILETVASIYAQWHFALNLFEGISLTVFIAEYAARLWVAPENPNYKSRLAWVRSPLALIDLLAILPTLLYLIFPMDLRLLRTFRMLRLLKLTRYSPALGMLFAVFEEEAGAFFAGFFILMLMLIFAASGAWIAEHNAQPDAFGSIPAAMWWAMATLTTVGYGDVTPITVAGKVFGALITVIGIGMAALPAGIIASGLNDQLHRRRAKLERQFRVALEDGNICEADEKDIETLRKQLGLSYRAAGHIREQIHAEMQTGTERCQSCGQPLPKNDTMDL